MIHLLILAVHLLATIAKLLRPGGLRAVVAESLLLKHQLVISSRFLVHGVDPQISRNAGDPCYEIVSTPPESPAALRR